MSDFVNIFEEVLRIVTFQPREGRMRYEPPRWEEGLQVPERKTRSDSRPR